VGGRERNHRGMRGSHGSRHMRSPCHCHLCTPPGAASGAPVLSTTPSPTEFPLVPLASNPPRHPPCSCAQRLLLLLLLLPLLRRLLLPLPQLLLLWQMWHPGRERGSAPARGRRRLSACPLPPSSPAPKLLYSFLPMNSSRGCTGQAGKLLLPKGDLSFQSVPWVCH